VGGLGNRTHSRDWRKARQGNQPKGQSGRRKTGEGSRWWGNQKKGQGSPREKKAKKGMPAVKKSARPLKQQLPTTGRGAIDPKLGVPLKQKSRGLLRRSKNIANGVTHLQKKRSKRKHGGSIRNNMWRTFQKPGRPAQKKKENFQEKIWSRGNPDPEPCEGEKSCWPERNYDQTLGKGKRFDISACPRENHYKE